MLHFIRSAYLKHFQHTGLTVSDWTNKFIYFLVWHTSSAKVRPLKTFQQRITEKTGALHIAVSFVLIFSVVLVVKSTALNRNKRWPCTDDRVHDCMGLEVQRQGGVNSWGARGLLAFRQASGICLEDPELNLLVPVRTHLLPEDWLSCPASWKTKDVSDATTLFNQSCLIIIPYYLLGACSLTLYSY